MTLFISAIVGPQDICAMCCRSRVQLLFKSGILSRFIMLQTLDTLSPLTTRVTHSSKIAVNVTNHYVIAEYSVVSVRKDAISANRACSFRTACPVLILLELYLAYRRLTALCLSATLSAVGFMHVAMEDLHLPDLNTLTTPYSVTERWCHVMNGIT